jgi:hypothetical protein
MSREDISGYTKLSLSLITILLLSIFSTTLLNSSDNAVASASNSAIAEQAETLFSANWSKADGPVLVEKTNRSWLWGPGPFTFMIEQYKESNGGQR